MTDTHLPLPADGGPDDLPRTLRRAREAKEREAQARESLARDGSHRDGQYGRDSLDAPVGSGHGASSVGTRGFGPVEPDMRAVYSEDLMPAAVRSLEIPFGRLVVFFLKAVLAAIPALILLTALLWGGGQLLKMYLPQLVHAEILIRFPN